MKKKFTCPRRLDEGHAMEGGPLSLDGPNKDYWRKDQTCSYDGSLHPDVFMDYCRAGKLIGVTTKSYKFYMEEYEGAVAGAKKFYTHHLSEDQGWEFAELRSEGKLNFDFNPPALYIPGPSATVRGGDDHA